MNNLDLDLVLKHYLACMLWTELDDCFVPLDSTYDIEDIAPESVESAKREIKDWLEYCHRQGLIDPFVGHYKDFVENRLGSDFWLTRNGHGTGLWDRDLGELGTKLTEACKTFGSVNAYVGDDNLIYLS